MEHSPEDRLTVKLELDVRELLERVAQDDKQAFRQLYHLFAGELQRYVFLFTRSPEDTEEILQDIFLKLWEKRQMLFSITSFRAYIYRMARNHVLNYFRSAKARIRTQSLSEKEEQQAFSASPAEQLLYKQYHKLASQALPTSWLNSIGQLAK